MILKFTINHFALMIILCSFLVGLEGCGTKSIPMPDQNQQNRQYTKPLPNSSPEQSKPTPEKKHLDLEQSW